MVLCNTNIFIEIYKGNDIVIETFKNIGQNSFAISDVTSADYFMEPETKKN